MTSASAVCSFWVKPTGTTIAKIHPADGTVIRTYDLGFTTCGLAFDGVNLWADNFYGTTIAKIGSPQEFVEVRD